MENKITKEEREILEDCFYYKWIARDHNGNLFLYTGKPFKTNKDGYYKNVWNTDEDFTEFPFNDLFQFIKLEDEEPYNIEELLKNEQNS